MTNAPDQVDDATFAGTGDAARAARSVDWRATPLGAIHGWPTSVRATARVCMASLTPMAVWAGPEFTLIHNDAYAQVLGSKAQWAMGRPGREVWAEAWDALEAEFTQVAQTGVPTRHENAPYVVGRNGHDEKASFTFTLSPIREDDGRIVGVLSACEENTASVQARAQSEDRYHALFNAIDEGFCIIEVLFEGDTPTDYRFVEVNPAFEKQTGIRGAVGRRVRELVPAHEEHWFQVYGRVAVTGEPVRFELPAAGLSRYYDVYAFRIGSPGQRHVAVLFHDITERKRADAAVRASEQKLSVAFANATIGFAINTPDGRFVDANPAYCAITGYGVDELRRTTISEIVDPDDRVENMQRIQRMLSGAISDFVIENRYVRRSGEVVWVRKSVSLVRDDAGAPLWLIALVEDVTERRRAEEALRRYELLASMTGDVVLFVRRDDGRIVDANAAALQAYGYSRDELLLLTIGDLRAPETNQTIQRDMSLADSQPRLFETVHRRKDGSTFAVEVSSVGATMNGARTLMSVVRDITARKRAEEALRRSEERYRTLFTNMTEGFALGEAILDADGAWRDFRLIEMNQAFEQQSGLRRDVAEGRPMREVLPNLEESWVETYCAIAMGAPPRRFESYNRDLDRHFSVYCFSPARGRFAVLFTDVSDRRRSEDALRDANERLRDADRRKTEFLGVLSHELRNPLAPIRNSIYVLEKTAPGSEQATRAKDVIRRQTDHLTRLVDDLLDVTRISRGKIALHRRRLDLRDVLRKTADDLRSLFESAGVDLHVHSGLEPVWVDADATRIAQVVGNLLQNAVKFTRAGGEASVALSVKNPVAEISVRDSGIGIAPAALESIFEPFTQIEQTLARTTGGLGLGLALVKGLVELHGGAVEARSEGLGRGTEFVVRVPLAAAAPEGPTDAVGAPSPRSCSVLIIEDNRDAAESLNDVLTLHGHTVRVARTGRSGLALAREWRPDVVLCDIGLPDMDGYAVADALRRDDALRQTRLVAVSGYAQPEDRERARAAGFTGHVAKPPDVDELLEIVTKGP